MGQALYRKYRSKQLTEIIGQEHITKTLGEALKQSKISHAYLFTGPRGVGKTSIARILAHEINDLPYDDEQAHLDIIEIDAASNRRIDEIRELRDKVYVTPTSAKYKVYIIDEVHMLTREAFNTLLKTLEEPPAHVVFILATTDAHKLPNTIVSRTQRYSFKPVSTAAVTDHLRFIAQQEAIEISDDALELIAKHGEGSFRDSISLLDQASGSNSKLELSDIQTLLGTPPDEAIISLLAAVARPTPPAELIAHLNGLYDQGFQAAAIAKQLAHEIRQTIMNSACLLSGTAAYDLLERLLEVPASHNPERLLEIIILKTAVDPRPSSTSSQTVSTVSESSAKTKTALQTKSLPTPLAEAIKQPVVEHKQVTKKSDKPTNDAPSAPIGVALLDETLWPEILRALKQKHNTLYGVVRMAQPTFSEKGLLLTFQFAFHQKRLNEATNRQVLITIIEELTGKKVTIDCMYDKGVSIPKVGLADAPVKDSAAISAISNIFGGGELLES